MRLQDKNLMQHNVRQFLEQGVEELYDNQTEALEAIEKFMGLPEGHEFVQQGREDIQEPGIKKGDFFEVVSATGSGKTRTLGSMAKAMDVPAFIISPRNILNKQARREFCEEIGILEDEVAVYDSKQTAAERRRVLEGSTPPKFVITTYQSLPSLVKRHGLDITNPDDKHYRPLVVLDEVHEAQGEETTKIINRLKESVLIAGFTATDGGASDTLFDGQLPIYKLPLINAIKRGIACKSVRTGVIDVSVDEAWVNNFLKARGGKEFNREDVERFARTPSVIEGAVKFHLTKVDDELGRIARLPTIFYTEGVTAAKDGAKAYNDYAKELGLSERAAFVSGAMGEKEYGPILEKFKRGEIQAVFNDKLLGMGFDAKNATVCYSLKLSNIPYVVEQQLGRVCRKQDKDYYDKYGMDKVALAINMRPKGTRPRLFGQVLGAATVDGPGYAPNFIPKNGEFSGYAVDLPDGIEVHLDYREMEGVITDSDAYHAMQDRIYPPKENWLSSGDLGERYVGSYKAHLALLERYIKTKTQEFISQGKTPEEAEQIVLDDYVGIRSSGSKVALFASPLAVKELEQKGELQSYALPKADWLSGIDLKKLYVGGSERHIETIKRYEQAKIKQLLDQGQTYEQAAAIVTNNYAGLRRSGPHEILCISPAAITELENNADLVPLNKKAQSKGDWLSSGDLMKLFTGSSDYLRKIIEEYSAKKIQDLLAQGISNEEATTLVSECYVGIRNAGVQDTLCINPSEIDELTKIFELQNRATKGKPKENWLSALDLSKLYIGGSPKHTATLERYIATKTQKLITEGKTPEEASEILDCHFVGMRSSSTREALCASPLCIQELEEDCVLKLRDVATSKSSDEYAEQTTFADKVGKRDISIDSVHLQRTGRTRVKSED